MLLYISQFQTEIDRLDKLLESLNFEVYKRKYDETFENCSNGTGFDEEDTFEKKCHEMDKILLLCSNEISKQCNTRCVSIEEQPLRKYSSYKRTFQAFKQTHSLSSKVAIVCFDAASHQHIQFEHKSLSMGWLGFIRRLNSAEQYHKKNACYFLPKDFHKLYCDLLQRKKTKHYTESLEWQNFNSVSGVNFVFSLHLILVSIILG